MEPILSFDKLTKKYKDFTLDHISFQIPRGMIVGMIGENGAGKTTTLMSVFEMISPDSGEIRLFGKNWQESRKENLQKIGLVMDGLNQNPRLYCRDLENTYKRIYKNWDSRLFHQYLERFSLPLNKKIKSFSKGMLVKLNFALALSYHPELLILDEATSGLDPVMRDEILELLQEFVMDENHSVLISSHITSDLDKIADYILFLHQGKLQFFRSMEEIENNYGILHCRKDFLQILSPDDYEAYIPEDFSCKVLVKNKQALLNQFQDLVMDRATLEDFMLFSTKGVLPCQD